MADQQWNVALAVIDRARHQPDAVAFRDDTRVVSYRALAASAVSVALHLREAGLRRKMVLGQKSDDVLQNLLGVLATALLGSRWAHAGGPALTVLQPGLFLGDSDTAAQLPEPHFQMDDTWLSPPVGADLQFPGHSDPDEIWMISQTSGTSGTPKLVGLSPRMVTLRNAANAPLFPYPGAAIACLFPAHAPAQLSRYLSALVHGGAIVASADTSVWETAGVRLVVGSPSQLQRLIGDRVLRRRLPAVHLSGGTAPDALVRHLLLSFEQVCNGYGSVETHNVLTTVKTIGQDGSLHLTTVRRDAEVQIVDDAGHPVPAGVEGHVRIRNAYLATGYIDNPAATAAAFRDGWFYPGDLGLWTREGNFLVTGRRNDQFNIGGVKLNAGVLDYALQNVPGVRDAITFLMPREGQMPRLTALLNLAPGTDPTEVLSSARIALLRLGGREAVPERFLFADELPRNPNGKPDRAGCVALVEAGRARKREAAEAQGRQADVP